MEKSKIFFVHALLKVLMWIFFAVIFAFMALVIGRVIYMFRLDKVNAEVAKIHATKLELKDVMGENLPPDPGEKADDTLAGYDVNQNGIRDDVELAIFREYPDSPKTRAPLLQYALALQMEFTQPIVNKKIVEAVAAKGDKGFFCISELINEEKDKLSSVKKFTEIVSRSQFNNIEREKKHKDFYSYLKSGIIDDSRSCDIDLGSIAKK